MQLQATQLSDFTYLNTANHTNDNYEPNQLATCPIIASPTKTLSRTDSTQHPILSLRRKPAVQPYSNGAKSTTANP